MLLFLHGARQGVGVGHGGRKASLAHTYAAALVREVADAFLRADRQLHRNDPARLLKAKQVKTEVPEGKTYLRQRAMMREGTSGLAQPATVYRTE